MKTSKYIHNDWNRESEFTFFHLEIEYYEKVYRFFICFMGIGFGFNIILK